VKEETVEHIKEGELTCGRHRFAVRYFVPRFIQTDVATSAFGFEWNKHPNTQFDSVNGMRLTEDRFYRQTNWPHDLAGQKILEVGSGAGRFTEIALKTGAEVFSVDASHAVDANWSNHGRQSNLTLCQASLYELPFPRGYFDKVFCFGVLQHTPDVSAAFAAIARHVKPGGDLAVDVYNKNYWRNYHTPMYLIRPLTKRISHERLYQCLRWSVPRLLPISTWLGDHIPVVGRQVKALIPIANYDGVFPTQSRDLLEQYSILDTFDTLAPQYVSPQRPETVRQWFLKAGYDNIQSDNDTVCAIRGKRLQKAAAIIDSENFDMALRK
jgi:ubiquinone/menaquinone biosynthesis C-methylase UbiE